ncbi:MAG: response regulator, partial [Pyrinomonadaceae bacterium]
MLWRLLEMEGATVATAGSGAAALEIATEQDFDVVLSDISMPGMDGFEFVRRLRQIENSTGLPFTGGAADITATAGAGETQDVRFKNVPVIALTGFGRAEDVARAKAEGFLCHVTKPIDVTGLTDMLRKLSEQDDQTPSTAS